MARFPVVNEMSWRERFSLGCLSISFLYSVFQYGGLAAVSWNVSLLLIGVAAIVAWPRAACPDLPSALLLFPLYLFFQVLPLPLFALRIFSPARSDAISRLTPLAGSVGFATLSVTPEATCQHILRMLGYTLVLFLIAGIARKTVRRGSWIAILPLIAAGGLEAAFGLWQRASGVDVLGTYVNKNHFAGLLEMTLPLAIAYASYLWMRGHGMLKALIMSGLSAVMFIGLADSLSRMGFVAGLGGVLCIAILTVARSLRGWRRWATLAGLGTLALFLVVFLPPDELIARVVSSSAGSEARWPIWRDTLHLIAAYRIFGCGLGTYETAFLQYQTSVVDRAFTFAHNDYLQVAAELGIVGCVILIAALIPILRRSFHPSMHRLDPSARYIALGCSGAFVAITLHSLTDFNMYIPANALVLAWIVGIAAGLGRGDDTPRHHKYFALAAGGLLLLYAPASIAFETFFRSDLRAEKLFCHFGICDTGQVVTAETLAHGGRIEAVSAPILLSALRRDADSPDRWCDTGEALLHQGRLAAATYCFRTAVSLGPDIPTVLLRAIRFSYATREEAAALQLGGHVLAITDVYDQMVFDVFREHKTTTPRVLAHAIDPNKRAAQSYLRYLIAVNQPRDAATAWDWSIEHRDVDALLAAEYVNHLLNDRKYAAASDAWSTYLGPRRDGYLDSNWIYDGGFEASPPGSPLDWQIDRRDGVDTARDSSVTHSGAYSLRVRFDGTQNLDYHQIRQTAYAKPGVYQFDAYVRAQDLTTDQGVALRIFDPDMPARLDVRTAQAKGTTGWTRLEATVVISPRTDRIWIEVVRQPSLRFDSDIQGTVWIDDVRLSPAESQHQR